MVFHRLYKLVISRAFTLVEMLISMVLISISALFLLSSISVASNLVVRATKLQAEADSAVSLLYSREADKLTELCLPVKLHFPDLDRYEDIDESILPTLTVYYSDIADGEIRFYYYDGGDGV